MSSINLVSLLSTPSAFFRFFGVLGVGTRTLSLRYSIRKD